MGKFMKDDVFYAWMVGRNTRCITNKHYPLYEIPREIDIDFRTNRVLNDGNFYKVWPVIKKA